jgi:hypothetical protein
MDIKDKVSPEDKQQMIGLIMECQMLTNLLRERNALAENKANEILAKNALSPNTYALSVNPKQDSWEANLKEGALVLPNRETRRAGRNN